MIRCWLTSCLLVALSPLFAFAEGENRQVVVRGTGAVTVPADELHLSVEVRTSGEAFDVIKQRNDVLLKQVMELATKHKLPSPPIESTLATFDFSAQAARQVAGSKGQKSQSSGKGEDPFAPDEKSPPLSLSRRITLRFEELEQATEVLTKLTSLDAVRESRELLLSPLQASVKDTSPHEAKARRQAVQLAREKAALLAEASGLELGAAIAIADETSSTSHSRPRLDDPFDPFGRHVPPAADDRHSLPSVFVVFEKKSPAAPDHLPPAQIEISVSVRITYEAQQPK